MLDDLRHFFRQSWRSRARVYSLAAGVLTLCMTLLGFSPAQQAANGPLWLVLAVAVLAFAGRRTPRETPAPTAPGAPRGQDRHEQDLATRSLLKNTPR